MIVGKKSDERIQAILQKRASKSIDYAVMQVEKSTLRPYVEKIYLYGSIARKEGSYQSDVDIFIELVEGFDVDEHKDDLAELRGHISPMDPDLPEVDMHVGIGSGWKYLPSIYYRDIINEGIIVWENQG